MEASKIINAVFGYLEMNMLPSMNDLQETAFYYAKEVIQEESNQIVDTAKDNLAFRILFSMDKTGDVDHEKLASRVRKAMMHKGRISFNVPLYGPVTFVPEDIDNIMQILENNHNETAGGYHENY